MKSAPLTAIVLGASGGIGGAMVAALRADRRFGDVHTLSRRENDFDLASEASIAAAAKKFDGLEVDLVFVATGILESSLGGPEKSFDALSAAAMHELFAVNAFGVGLAIKYFSPKMPRNRRSVFAALSARVGSISDNRLGGWISYRASKAALNQIIRCAAIEFGRQRKESIFAALHPGTIESDLTREYARGRYTASADECASQLLQVLDSLSPDDSGGFFAYDGAQIEW
ncbi:MAG: SDR family NAD(P)-dependent oxidoreductase [Alphaproteobacteria bacterium]|nr:SDR family NAD(P)-dependent oxidoreductase [Alphaproteobacteria bacterium]